MKILKIIADNLLIIWIASAAVHPFSQQTQILLSLTLLSRAIYWLLLTPRRDLFHLKQMR